jgi:hypothetical protein
MNTQTHQIVISKTGWRTVVSCSCNPAVALDSAIVMSPVTAVEIWRRHLPSHPIVGRGRAA